MSRQPDREFEDSATVGDHQPSPPHISPGARQLTGQLSKTVSKVLGCEMTFTLTDVLALTYAEFLASISEPRCCWLLHITGESDAAGKGNGLAWLELEPQIAQRIVAGLLGDDVTGSGELRPLTPVDRKLMTGFVRALCDAVDATLLAGGRAHIALPVRQNSSGDSVFSMSPDQPVQVIEMVICLGSLAGQLRLCLPDQFIASAAPEGSSVSAGQDQPLLANQAASSPPVPQASHETVQLSVVSPAALLPADELAGMQPGDILVTDTDADGEMIVRLDGTESFIASLGSRNGRRSVRIERKIESE